MSNHSTNVVEYKFTQQALTLMEKGLDFTPSRATEHAAGYDLKACIETPKYLLPGEVYKFPTGVCIYLGKQMPLAGLYLPRSSNPGLKLENTVGLLDADYQQESFLKYRNMSDDVVTIMPGERIGQLVIFPILFPTMTKVDAFSESTKRSGGFGSTGKL